MSTADTFPVLGDWVYYWMPDRTPRPALVVRAWEGDKNDAVSLRVFGSADDTDLAARERELRAIDGQSWYANQVTRRDKSKLSHAWSWRPEVHSATGLDVSKAVPNPVPASRETFKKAEAPIVLDEPQATPPPPLPVG